MFTASLYFKTLLQTFPNARLYRFPIMSSQSRSSAAITFSVWRALFLREALTRLFARRAAWVWLLMEPVFHISYMLVIFTVIRTRTVGGIDTTIWLLAGMTAFFTFRRTASQAQNAVGANQALFAYRQVKPVDPVLVRSALEALLMLVVSIILFSGAGLFGHVIMPEDPLLVLTAFIALWLIGLGWGLITSVATELVPELATIINFFMTPLYFISGVIFPIASIPHPYREWLLLNPLVHGLEAARLGFAPYYHAIPELSMLYLYGFALVAVFFGLALHKHYAMRLTRQ